MNKPKLKASRRVYFELSYQKFDEFVNKVYGEPFEFVYKMECLNDTVHSFEARKNPKFKSDGKMPKSVWDIFTDLANKELIEEGEYLISVCW